MANYVPKLKQKRLENNLTQAELAKKAKLRKRVVGQYEGGGEAVRYPKIEVLKRLCEALNCSIRDLDPNHPVAKQFDEIREEPEPSANQFDEIREEPEPYYSKRCQKPLRIICENWDELDKTEKDMIYWLVERIKEKKNKNGDSPKAETG